MRQENREETIVIAVYKPRRKASSFGELQQKETRKKAICCLSFAERPTVCFWNVFREQCLNQRFCRKNQIILYQHLSKNEGSIGTQIIFAKYVFSFAAYTFLDAQFSGSNILLK